MDHGVQAILSRLPQCIAQLLWNVLLTQNLRPNRVVNIVIDIGDLIAESNNLPLRRMRGKSSLMIADSIPDLPGQIEPLPLLLQKLYHPHTLFIVAEAPGINLRERPFSGMTEGSMAQIMAQSDSLCQILIHAQSLGDGSGILGHLQCVRHTSPVMVTQRG